MPSSLQPYRMLIGAASKLVPGPKREEWQQEWMAEIEWRLDTLGRWNRMLASARLGLAVRCLGAFLDAASLRLDSLRQGVWGDIRFGMRLLGKSPGFAISAIIALAIGIGANTTLFSAVNALLWQKPQVHDPDRVVAVYTADYSSTRFGTSSFPDFEALGKQSRTLLSVSAFVDNRVRAEFGEEAEQVDTGFVSASYWATLGVRPVAGGIFESDFDAAALIGEALWERRFSRDSGILGQPIRLNGKPYRITGILPRAFAGTHLRARPQIWVPLRRVVDLLGASEEQLHNPASRSLFLLGRLAPTATMRNAQAELDVLARQWATANPPAWTDVRGKQRAMTAVPVPEAILDPDLRESAGQIAMLAFGVIGTLLVIVCATVATMLLARAQARRKEMAIRLSMGAERFRLLRQLLTESGLLCLCGGVGGVLLARWSLDWLNRRPELWMGLRGVELAINPAVVGYAAVIVFVSTLLAGVAPGLRATRQGLVVDLKDECTPMSARFERSRAAWVFVAGQVALSLVLLMAGALLVRSLRNLQTTYPGFSAKGMLIARVEPSGRRTPVESFALVHNLQEHLAATPGVERVALASNVLLVDRFGRRGIRVEGYDFAPGEVREFHTQFVTPGYFSTMEIPMLQGRDFTWRDGPEAPRVVIVNELFARRFWPNQTAIGRRLQTARGPLEIVGVTAAAQFHRISDPAMAMLFFPIPQEPRGSFAVHVKSRLADDAMAPLLRQRLREFDRQLFTPELSRYSEAIARKALPERFATTLAATAGLLALFLAALGLYGVLSHAVSQSTREIGIRLAIGASQADIMRHVFGRAARLILPGAATGVLGAIVFSRMMEKWLYGVGPYDPLSLASVLALLLVISVLAAWLPTRRALRIAPSEALRYQ